MRSKIIQNESNFRSHWSVLLINDSSYFTKSQILENTTIRFKATKFNGEEISAPTVSKMSVAEANSETISPKPESHYKELAKQAGIKGAFLDGDFYIKAKENQNCRKSCDLMDLQTNDRAARSIMNDAQKCKDVFNALGDNYVKMYPNSDNDQLSSAINEAINATVARYPSAKKFGCNKSRWPVDPINHHSTLGKYDPDGTTPKTLKVYRVCSCE